MLARPARMQHSDCRFLRRIRTLCLERSRWVVGVLKRRRTSAIASETVVKWFEQEGALQDPWNHAYAAFVGDPVCAPRCSNSPDSSESPPRSIRTP